MSEVRLQICLFLLFLVDRYKKNNMNRVKYLKKECEIEEKEKESENVLV